MTFKPFLMTDNTAARENTDREIWRRPDEGNGSYYADSLHITKEGALGINCAGSVYVKPIREWHALADRDIDRFHLADLLLCHGEFGTSVSASKEGALRCADAIIAWRRPRPLPAPPPVSNGERA
jgi:hypothetical protein